MEPNLEFPTESRPGDRHTTDFEDHKLDVYKLIAISKELETEELDLASLAKFRENNYWHDSNGNWISPGQIINAYASAGDWDKIVSDHPEWEREIRKIQEADYHSYPLLLIGEVVVDGIHRLTKAYIENATLIKVKRFSQLPNEAIIIEPGE